MKKILFPIDFSENSFHAFVYALHMAKKLHAEIITIHVYPDVDVFPDYSDFLSQNYSIREWSDFENYKSEVPKLKDLAETHHAVSVKISHVLERGNVIEKILEIEESENIDCIVLGTKGATGLKEIFLGSVAEQVVNRAKGVVLAIPENCTFPKISKMLLLAKYEKPYLKIVQQLLPFADAFDAHIDVLQIKDAPNNNETRIIREWKREFADADIDFHILATNILEETAIDFAELHNSNLIVLAVHEKGFFEKLFFFSLSRQMTFHSHIPVMAIHAKKLN